MKAFTAITVLTTALLMGCGAQDEPQEQAESESMHQLVWVDRSGQIQGNVGPVMNSILDPSIAPNGSRIAVRGRENSGDTDHLYILEDATARRLTDNEGFERHMIWSPDGSRIAYSIQEAGGVSNLYIRAGDGSGEDQPVVVSEGMHKWYPSWTPDAKTVVFHTNNPETQARDLWSADVASGEMGVLVDDDGIQALARVSRDGRFVAYQSDQTGRTEIFVTTLPASEDRWQVSTGGGTWPKWSNDELFYWEGNTLVAVPVMITDSGFQPGSPQRLFTGAQVGMGADNMMTSYNPEYDVAPEGTMFVVTQRVGG